MLRKIVRAIAWLLFAFIVVSVIMELISKRNYPGASGFSRIGSTERTWVTR